MEAAAAAARARHRLLLAIGGDNSISYAVMRGLFGAEWPECGLVTVDAHHDLRDGVSNGSPVRRLAEAGLAGGAIAQVGIADFANSAAYARRARDLGVTVLGRELLRERPAEDVMREALDVAGAGGRPVYVDLDVDVCDRAVVPGCPAASPGGITADELRRIAFVAGADPRVRGIDITEVDATADAPDGRTVRLAALLVLEVATGIATRRDR
jgi:formiminoglutamase